MKIMLLTIFILLVTYLLVWLVYEEHLYRKRRKQFEDNLKKFKNEKRTTKTGSV